MNDLEQALRESAEQAANDQVSEGGSPIFDVPEIEGSAVTAEALADTPDAEVVPDVAPVTVEPVVEPAVEEVPAEFVIPESWTERERELYAAANESGQTWIQEKGNSFQSAFTKKSQELSDQVKVAEDILQALQPINNRMQQHALSPEQAVAQLVQSYSEYEALSQNWNSDPLGTMQKFLGTLPQDQRQSIIDQIGGGIDPYDQQVTTAAPSAELQAAEQRIARLEQNQQSAQVSQLESHLTAFNEAKNEDGSLAHPHFSTVKQTMGALMGHAGDRGVDLTLEDAYTQAVRANPETWALLKKQDVETSEARRKQVNAKAVSTQPARMPETVLVNGQSDDAVTLTGKAAIRAEAFKLGGIPLP